MSTQFMNRTGAGTSTRDAISLTPVKSSNIAKLGWLDGTLHVEFSNGGLFSYAGVDQTTYNDLLAAKSIGSHFAKHIRPKHKGVKL
jgi:hypothetical protein